MRRNGEHDNIIGKYRVTDYTKPTRPFSMLTDNPLEAVWEANRVPTREVTNLCGEKEIYRDGSIWRVRK